ncbi:hypothetical protein EJB05_39204, partial [Eragrostis curvula]
MRKRRLLLRCPTSLVAVTLLHCHGTDGLDLDAQGVRFLRYDGYLDHFPFTSAASGVRHAGEPGARRAQVLQGTAMRQPSFK